MISTGVKRIVTFAFLISFTGTGIYAAEIECVELSPNDTVELSISPDGDFPNCFSLASTPAQTDITFVLSSYGDVSSKISLYDLAESSGSTYISEYYTSPNGSAAFMINSTDRSVAFTIEPTSHTTTDKNVTITVINVEGTTQVVVQVDDVPDHPSSPPGGSPPGGGGGCVGVFCVDPDSNIGQVPLSMMSANGVSCTGNQNPPPGEPNDFDINGHLEQFENSNATIDQLPSDAQAFARAAYMVSQFAPGRRYDVKNNPEMLGSEEFGNWFFGAAASIMGYSEAEALKAAAIVQQWQNYGSESHPDADDLAQLLGGILVAVATGQGDDPDDVPMISGGHSYTEDVYRNDTNSSAVSNSCDSSDSATTDTESSEGGWSGGGIFLGFGGCIGSCQTPVVIVEDLPDDPEPPSDPN